MKADLFGFGITLSTILGVAASSMAAITESQQTFMMSLEAEYRARSCARQLARAYNLAEWSKYLRGESWQTNHRQGIPCKVLPMNFDFVPWQKNAREIQRPGQWDIRAQKSATQAGRSHTRRNESASVDLTLILATALLIGTWATCASHIERVNTLWSHLDSADGNDELCLRGICIPPRNDNESAAKNRAFCAVQQEEVDECSGN
jgi:hypothetical protein